MENKNEARKLQGRKKPMHWVPYIFIIILFLIRRKLKLNCNIYFEPFFVRRSLITLKYNLLEFSMLSNHLITQQCFLLLIVSRVRSILMQCNPFAMLVNICGFTLDSQQMA